MARRFAVIGIGRFGTELVKELHSRGVEVLALDTNRDHLDDVRSHASLAVEIDSTDVNALKAQDITSYDAIVVAFGENFETTLLTIAALQQIQVKRIIARASTATHERILNNMGINDIILPVVEAAGRLANNLIYEGVLDTFDISKDYSIIEIPAPEDFHYQSLEQLQLEDAHDISLVTIKRTVSTQGIFGKKKQETIIGIPKPKTQIQPGDILVAFGTKRAIQNLVKMAAKEE